MAVFWRRGGVTSNSCAVTGTSPVPPEPQHWSLVLGPDHLCLPKPGLCSRWPFTPHPHMQSCPRGFHQILLDLFHPQSLAPSSQHLPQSVLRVCFSPAIKDRFILNNRDNETVAKTLRCFMCARHRAKCSYLRYLASAS